MPRYVPTMVKLDIPDSMTNKWMETYLFNRFQYEIDSEIVQSISEKPLPEIDDNIHYLPLDMRNWLDNTSKRYKVVVELGHTRKGFYIEFEDQDVATQFSVTWL